MTTRKRYLDNWNVEEKRSGSGIGTTIKVLFFLFLIIFIPVMIWLLTRKKISKELDETCNADTECARGLKCIAGKCAIEPCEKPKKPTGIFHVETPGNGSIDVTLAWSWVPHADAYLIFMGDSADFDPFEGAIYSTVSKESNRLFEEIPYGETVHVKVIAISNDCGLSEASDVHTFTTSSAP